MTKAEPQGPFLGKLHYRIGNRDLDSAHVEELKRSIADYGYLDVFPVIVNRKLEIIDGQHKYAACLALGVEPAVSVTDDINALTVYDVHRAVKKWTMADRLFSMASLGHESAKKILALAHEFRAQPAVVISTLYRDVDFQKFSSDSLTLDDEYRIRLMLVDLVMFESVTTHQKVYVCGRILGAYKRLLKIHNFDKLKLRKSLETHGREMFIYCSTVLSQVRNLVDIYNYHTREENRIPYPADSHKTRSY